MSLSGLVIASVMLSSSSAVKIMPNRKADIEALIQRSERDFAAARSAYNESLQALSISAELRIDIRIYLAT
jgi:hypothetical protein